MGEGVEKHIKWLRLFKNKVKPMASWQSGHRVRLQNRRSRVRIPSGCEVFRNLCIAVLLSKLNTHCHCVYLKKLMLLKKTKVKNENVSVNVDTQILVRGPLPVRLPCRQVHGGVRLPPPEAGHHVRLQNE
jgi:hypothetical protein